MHTGLHLSKSGKRGTDKGARVQLLPPLCILKVPSAAGRCVQERVGHGQVAMGSKGRDDFALETQGHQLTSKWGYRDLGASTAGHPTPARGHELGPAAGPTLCQGLQALHRRRHERGPPGRQKDKMHTQLWTITGSPSRKQHSMVVTRQHFSNRPFGLESWFYHLLTV